MLFRHNYYYYHYYYYDDYYYYHYCYYYCYYYYCYYHYNHYHYYHNHNHYYNDVNIMPLAAWSIHLYYFLIHTNPAVRKIKKLSKNSHFNISTHIIWWSSLYQRTADTRFLSPSQSYPLLHSIYPYFIIHLVFLLFHLY